MTHREFVSWQEYFAEAPFDDHHRYHRPAVLVSQSMVGGDVKDKFAFLEPGKSAEESAFERTLAAFGVEPSSGNI